MRTVSINQPAPGGPHEVVILGNLHANPHPSPEVLKRILNLTSSEARLVNEIAGGRSAEEIANAAHVPVGTVRKRLATVLTCLRGAYPHERSGPADGVSIRVSAQ
ncbi:helix-turn-helix transcriptional regulator [Methylobacterium sp. WSM2598]|uniref:helix-turn-helix transcriptional regulator n=1 Tax=Methylobacterium sp. WSM2598 TaxID=398261 RepID=UPI00039B1FE5|nr:hypothetical protein [Methylobacterium sp. WSM2598]